MGRPQPVVPGEVGDALGSPPARRRKVEVTEEWAERLCPPPACVHTASTLMSADEDEPAFTS